MLRIGPRTAVVVGRIVMVAVRCCAILRCQLERIGEQPEQQFARIALTDEVIQSLQVDRPQEAFIERAGLLSGDVEVAGDRRGVAGRRVAKDYVATRREKRRGGGGASGGI